jgi:hypothetical protein
MGVLRVKGGQERRQEVFTRDRTGGQGEFAGERGLSAKYLLSGFLVQQNDALCVGMQTLASLAEEDVSAFAAEERHIQGSLQRPNALADGCLGKPEGLRRGREAAQFGGCSESLQVRQRSVHGKSRDRRGSNLEGYFTAWRRGYNEKAARVAMPGEQLKSGWKFRSLGAAGA